ncbi:hypothetical protein N8A88_22165 [Pseudomonas shahriarae]|uniref:hypothetical protein n=1 Tax=Pseudomonas shahriarae TaxID=2745512 RepID=UPI0021CA6E18|nr:hypothetical protein [Pseudomonas shahriarae]MCU0213298.1 hypothetical protein [Pseudomonas shahriarae]
MTKVTQLRTAGGKVPKQHMWEAVREHQNNFTIRMIATASGQPLTQVRAYIQAMKNAELVELVDSTGDTKDQRWRLVRDEGADHPRLRSNGQRSIHGLGLENLWRSMRILKKMTAAEAADMASVNGVRVTQAYAINYFTLLVRAGYLIASDHDSKRDQTFEFVPGMNTGPRHPVVQRTESVQVFDANTEKVVYAKETTGGVPGTSEPANDVQQENLRLRKLVKEFVETTSSGPTQSLLQRAQLELAE